MSFGEWRAFARPREFGRDVQINIGREIAPNKWDLITHIGGDSVYGTTIETVDEGAEPSSVMALPEEAAKALYLALDRLYGHVNQDGKVEALEAALLKEQARVDFFLNAFLRPQAVQQPAPHHQFTEGS